MNRCKFVWLKFEIPAKMHILFVCLLASCYVSMKWPQPSTDWFSGQLTQWQVDCLGQSSPLLSLFGVTVHHIGQFVGIRPHICCKSLPYLLRPQGHIFTWWGCCILFLCLFLSMVLSTAFHSLHSPDNSPWSHSVLSILSLSYWSFQLKCFFMKVFFCPDLITRD